MSFGQQRTQSFFFITAARFAFGWVFLKPYIASIDTFSATASSQTPSLQHARIVRMVSSSGDHRLHLLRAARTVGPVDASIACAPDRTSACGDDLQLHTAPACPQQTVNRAPRACCPTRFIESIDRAAKRRVQVEAITN